MWKGKENGVGTSQMRRELSAEVSGESRKDLINGDEGAIKVRLQK